MNEIHVEQREIETETDSVPEREGRREGGERDGGQAMGVRVRLVLLCSNTHFVLCGRPNGANKTFYAIGRQTKRGGGGEKEEELGEDTAAKRINNKYGKDEAQL